MYIATKLKLNTTSEYRKLKKLYLKGRKHIIRKSDQLTEATQLFRAMGARNRPQEFRVNTGISQTSPF